MESEGGEKRRDMKKLTTMVQLLKHTRKYQTFQSTQLFDFV